MRYCSRSLAADECASNAEASGAGDGKHYRMKRGGFRRSLRGILGDGVVSCEASYIFSSDMSHVVAKLQHAPPI